MKLHLPLVLASAVALSACATTTTSGPVEVTRFHLDTVGSGTLAVEPLSGGASPPSLEYQTYAAAAQGELLRLGFTTPAPNTQAAFLAVVGFTRTAVDGPPRQSPVSVGIGGGGFSGGGGYGRRAGGGVGLGGGVSFPIGRARPRQVIATQMSVQLRRRSDGTVVWEGRAQTFADSNSPQSVADAAAGRLARALFQGFPGESGRTITVR